MNKFSRTRQAIDVGKTNLLKQFGKDDPWIRLCALALIQLPSTWAALALLLKVLNP